MSRLERAIGWLSPWWAARRTAARARLRALAREPAPGRRRDPWTLWSNYSPGRASSAEDLGAALRRLVRERGARR